MVMCEIANLRMAVQFCPLPDLLIIQPLFLVNYFLFIFIFYSSLLFTAFYIVFISYLKIDYTLLTLKNNSTI